LLTLRLPAVLGLMFAVVWPIAGFPWWPLALVLEIEARFLRDIDELPPGAVEYIAGQVKVSATSIAAYPWSGRSIKYHREQIRAAFGFREVHPRR
jgi:hypothetical protein